LPKTNNERLVNTFEDLLILAMLFSGGAKVTGDMFDDKIIFNINWGKFIKRATMLNNLFIC
jgi:hypothetical protein